MELRGQLEGKRHGVAANRQRANGSDRPVACYSAFGAARQRTTIVRKRPAYLDSLPSCLPLSILCSPCRSMEFPITPEWVTR